MEKDPEGRLSAELPTGSDDSEFSGKSGVLLSVERLRAARERETTSYSDGQSDGGGTGRSDGPK
jgi:hypothetical protein